MTSSTHVENRKGSVYMDVQFITRSLRYTILIQYTLELIFIVIARVLVHTSIATMNKTPVLNRVKGALSRQFCYILVETAQIFDKEPVS